MICGVWAVAAAAAQSKAAETRRRSIPCDDMECVPPECGLRSTQVSGPVGDVSKSDNRKVDERKPGDCVRDIFYIARVF